MSGNSFSFGNFRFLKLLSIYEYLDSVSEMYEGIYSACIRSIRFFLDRFNVCYKFIHFLQTHKYYLWRQSLWEYMRGRVMKTDPQYILALFVITWHVNPSISQFNNSVYWIHEWLVNVCIQKRHCIYRYIKREYGLLLNKSNTWTCIQVYLNSSLKSTSLPKRYTC